LILGLGSDAGAQAHNRRAAAKDEYAVNPAHAAEIRWRDARPESPREPLGHVRLEGEAGERKRSKGGQAAQGLGRRQYLGPVSL